MKKMNFSIDIRAPKDRVWKTLWEDSNYRKWTSAFAEGSHAVTDWNEGSKVLFLDGKGQGMVSRIEKNRPNEYMSIEHLGIVKDGVEDINSEKVKDWQGAHENYTLKEKNGVTTLEVDMDSSEEFKEYFENTWPKALDLVKRISEDKN
jgi:hypothetical protein